MYLGQVLEMLGHSVPLSALGGFILILGFIGLSAKNVRVCKKKFRQRFLSFSHFIGVIRNIRIISSAGNPVSKTTLQGYL